jgi:hypothetical protein
MKRLILTGWLMPEFVDSDVADLAVTFFHRFIWGELPSPAELAAYLGPRLPDQHSGYHWSGFADKWAQSRSRDQRDLSLAEFCQRYEVVELWFDTRPDAQLQLIWLLDYFRDYPETVTRLKLRLVDLDMNRMPPGQFNGYRPPAADVTEAETDTARVTWFAYREPTPEACFGLLREDLGALPLLKPALRDLLAELPSTSTGLGATEMRMLELIGRGYEGVNALFHLRELRQTRIFNEWQHGYLLDGLAFGPKPAVAGLGDELRTISRDNLGARHPVYLRSRLALTDFGEAVVAHEEDFSRHNPIDRWWGGTHLTNDNLWRYDPVLTRG